MRMAALVYTILCILATPILAQDNTQEIPDNKDLSDHTLSLEEKKKSSVESIHQQGSDEFAQEDKLQDLLDYVNFGDALEKRGAGSISAIDSRLTPVSVIHITQDMIKVTPARNLLDLIEIYVPGTMWVAHVEGPHPGFRGLIADRNTKMLLTVDGVVMNQKAHNGVTGELENWDLSDIDHIDVVLGPGSVTYGAGAVSGVINLITRKPQQDKRTNIGFQAINSYRSLGFHLNQDFNNTVINGFAHVSLVQTEGFIPRFYAGGLTPGRAGFASNQTRSHADYLNQPQLKAHLEFDIGSDWKAWIRYNQLGRTQTGGLMQLAPGTLVDNPGLRTRQVVSALQYSHLLTSQFNVQGLLSVGSQDVDRTNGNYAFTGFQTIYSAPSPDIDNGRDKRLSFREDQILARLLLNYITLSGYQLAVGAEYSWNFWGPGWFKRSRAFVMGDSFNIVSDPVSDAVANLPKNVGPIVVGKGWGTHTISLFGETNKKFMQELQALLSARIDANSYSHTLLSPRIALVSDLQQGGVIKLLAQQSLRMNTAEQLLLQHLSHVPSAAETLRSVELSYNTASFSGFHASASAYYMWIQPLGWKQIPPIYGDTVKLGTLKLAGGEITTEYVNSLLQAGLSQAIAKQLSWVRGAGIASSGISYSSYNKQVSDVTTPYFLQGVGNDLNNWHTTSTKLFITAFSPAQSWGRLFAHLDWRIFWGMQGAQDGLTMLKKAAQGTSEQGRVDSVVDAVRAQDAYGLQTRMNISLGYEYNDDVTVTLLIYDLFKYKGNRRYVYDGGLSTSYPGRTMWTEEPQALALKADFKF